MDGLDVNSQAAAFPSLGKYQRVVQSEEAPPRQHSGTHLVTAKPCNRSASRVAGGRGSTSSVGVPPRPMRSGATRGGGGVAQARSLTNAERA